jgi:lysophospholipase L1-like esterase
VELAVRWRYRSIELYRNWRWLVETHLIEQSWDEYLARQARLSDLRAQQGMERGRSHPVFGWTYNPGFAIDDAELGIRLHINNHALRGEEFPTQKPAGELRILCLGGSTTAGEEVADEATYPAQLQALLRARLPGRSIRVINGGVPSYAVKQSLDLYALSLRHLEADYVTIYHGINDLLDFAHGGVAIERSTNFNHQPVAPFVFEGDAVEATASLPREIVRSFLQRSLAWQLWREGRTIHLPVQTDPDRVEAGLALFAGRYGLLLDEIASHAALPVPVTFEVAFAQSFEPSERNRIEQSLHIWLDRAGIAVSDGPDVVAAMNARVTELARQRGIPLAEVAGRVPPDAEHFVDCCHLTVAGNHRIAEILAETLLARITAEH